MADDDKSISSSSSSTEQNPSPTGTGASSAEFPVSDEDPPPPDKEDDELCRHSKKQKKGPMALDKIQHFEPSNLTPSFTFDTKSSASTPQITPKFGCFNSANPNSLALKDQPYRNLQNKREETDEATDEAVNVSGVLRVLDGIEGPTIPFPHPVT